MRISSLPALAQCPGWWLLRRREDASGGEGRSKPAADTGSAAGRMIELYHLGFPSREACALAEQEAPERFPAANLGRARWLATAYAADPANPPEVATDMEKEVRMDLDGVELVGHVDQVRAGAVWDVKAGKALDGLGMLGSHAMQIAAYAVAGGWEPGGIIRLASYEDGGPVRFQFAWNASDALRMLDTVRGDVAALRAGRALIRPGLHCAWCPAGNPSACLSRLRNEPPRAEEIV